MNKKKMIILRGCPASGKSFIAQKLCGKKGVVCSADDYHLSSKTGKYNWKPENIKLAHEQCRNKVFNCIKLNISPICIDNTNIKRWELLVLKPLILEALKHNYIIKILEPNPTWYFYKTAFNAEQLFLRSCSTHNVPLDVIKDMIENYVPNISINDILEE